MTYSEERPQGWVAVGGVRGWCGHVHATAEEADGCCYADQRSVGSRGYSDRRTFPADSERVCYNSLRGFWLRA